LLHQYLIALFAVPSLKDFPVVHQKGVSLPASVDFEKGIVFFQSVYFHVDKSYQPPTYPPRSVEDVLTTFFSRPSSPIAQTSDH
jgi:hypothetical protein